MSICITSKCKDWVKCFHLGIILLEILFSKPKSCPYESLMRVCRNGPMLLTDNFQRWQRAHIGFQYFVYIWDIWPEIERSNMGIV